MACTAAHDTHRDQPWYSSIIIEVALMLGWVFMCPHNSCSATKQAATYDVLDYQSTHAFQTGFSAENLLNAKRGFSAENPACFASNFRRVAPESVVNQVLTLKLLTTQQNEAILTLNISNNEVERF